jgi:nicotinate dehydrogenase subunit B
MIGTSYDLKVTRRHFGLGVGAFVATFALGSAAPALAADGPSPPMSFGKNKRLDGWIWVGEDNTITVFTGKAELGQGILTALAQITAEELDVGIGQLRMVSADTSRSPDEGYTFGSQSVEQGGAALRMAGAQARAVLTAAAAQLLRADAASLKVEGGVVQAPDGKRTSYGDLVRSAPSLLRQPVDPATVMPKSPSTYSLVGRDVARIDLPAKVLAKGVFLQDLREPGMLFGRVVRPPRPGAKLLDFDEKAVRALPGVVSVTRAGSFLGVVAKREEQALAAAARLGRSARWSGGVRLPDEANLAQAIRGFAGEDIVIKETGQAMPAGDAVRWVEATYSRPYLCHASIGPSCAVAKFAKGHLTVWSHTQGAYPLRGDLATALGLDPRDVDVIHVQAAGCYGHNGADDAAFDAALLALSVQDRAVKLQWSRQDEFAWSPIGPAMVMQAKAAVSAEGRIVDWNYELWSNSHATRPGQPGGLNLLGAWHLDKGFHISPPAKIPQPFGNGDRNALPLYDVPRQRIVHHLLSEMPLRTGSLRTLGGHGNLYAIECFMDELAQAAGADPVAFRLAHLRDPRARAVVEAAAKAAGWESTRAGGGRRGRGFAYGRYKNVSTYVAIAVDVDVVRTTGDVRLIRAVAAVDAGQIVNPDGVRSQCEGGIVQGLGWALKERARFDREAITSLDWSHYPIMTFGEVPAIEVVLLDRPNDPSLGAGEATLGPASAALANAVANALGQRVRDLPLSPERIKSLI